MLTKYTSRAGFFLAAFCPRPWGIGLPNLFFVLSISWAAIIVAAGITVAAGDVAAGDVAPATGSEVPSVHSASQWELIDNSATMSQVIDLNQHGHVVGIRDVPLANIGSESEPFVYMDGQEQVIPKPPGFTNLMPEAISDNRCVVGYVSRVIGHPEGSMRGFIFSVGDNQINVLPPLEGHNGSHAFDINDDGSVISGYSTGRNPQSMIPCVWQRSNGQWQTRALATIHDFNPYLLSSRVIVSGDGLHVVACITVEIIPGDITRYVSHLYQWTRNASDEWQRQARFDKALQLAAINNRTTITGTCQVENQRRAFVLNPQNQLQVLGLLEADVSAEAADINNHGQVVGYSDDPHGPESGPQAFIWSSGKVMPIEFPRPVAFSSATAINDDGQIAGFIEPTVEDSKQDKTISFVLSMHETLGEK